MQVLLEYNSTPGTVYENCLLYGDGGGAILNEMDIHESVSGSVSIVKFRGKFQEADAINKNKRSYPYDILNSNVRALQETIKSGGLLGELDHPTDSIVHFANASHKITKLWWENKTLMGEGIILNTPCGKILKSLINDGARIGISSRGVGSGKVNEDGVLVIGESYKLITFDAVADPSTHSAFQERVKEYYSPKITQETTKNESINIYNNKELLLVCLESLIKNKTQEIKVRSY